MKYVVEEFVVLLGLNEFSVNVNEQLNVSFDDDTCFTIDFLEDGLLLALKMIISEFDVDRLMLSLYKYLGSRKSKNYTMQIGMYEPNCICLFVHVESMRVDVNAVFQVLDDFILLMDWLR